MRVAVDGEDELAFGAREDDWLVEDQQSTAALGNGEALAVHEEFDFDLGGIAGRGGGESVGFGK